MATRIIRVILNYLPLGNYAFLDVERLRTLQEAREAELERLVEAHKRGALAQAAKLRNKLHPGVAGQVKALLDVAKKPDFFPHPTFTLDTPFLIWSNPLLQLNAHAAPFDSWAKFKYKTSQYRGTQKVSFYFYWPNPFSDFAVINATTFMSALGHLKSHAPWGFWVNTSWVEARERFGLWFGVPQEVNPVGYEERLVGITGAYGSATTGGETNSTNVSAGLQLSKTMFAVPPKTVVVFEVALAVNFENDDGDIEADFQSGEFRIACPLVVFSLLNSPPAVAVSAKGVGSLSPLVSGGRGVSVSTQTRAVSQSPLPNPRCQTADRAAHTRA